MTGEPGSTGSCASSASSLRKLRALRTRKAVRVANTQRDSGVNRRPCPRRQGAPARGVLVQDPRDYGIVKSNPAVTPSRIAMIASPMSSTHHCHVSREPYQFSTTHQRSVVLLLRGAG